MAVDTEVRTFSDIYTEILNKMRQPTNVTAISNQAKRYANTALVDMVFGFEYKLPWLERDAVLITRAPYTTGTVTTTIGSVTVTGASTLWSTVDAYGIANARATGKMSFGDNNIYGITSVGGAGTITLANRFVSTAALAAASYTYFEDEYALATDFLKLVDIRRFTSAYPIELIGRNDFKRRYPRPNIAGTPKTCTLIDKEFSANATPKTYVQFYPYPNAALMIPYSYITSNLAVSTLGVSSASMSADTDEPALPVRYRNALVSFACWKWYRDKKDDARADSAKADYLDEVTRIVGDQRIGANTTARIQPRPQSVRTIYRGSAGKYYSTNNSFDDFRT